MRACTVFPIRRCRVSKNGAPRPSLETLEIHNFCVHGGIVYGERKVNTAASRRLVPLV